MVKATKRVEAFLERARRRAATGHVHCFACGAEGGDEQTGMDATVRGTEPVVTTGVHFYNTSIGKHQECRKCGAQWREYYELTHVRSVYPLVMEDNEKVV